MGHGDLPVPTGRAVASWSSSCLTTSPGGSIQVPVNYSGREAALQAPREPKCSGRRRVGDRPGDALAPPLTNSLTAELASRCLSFPSCKVGLTRT